MNYALIIKPELKAALGHIKFMGGYGLKMPEKPLRETHRLVVEGASGLWPGIIFIICINISPHTVNIS